MKVARTNTEIIRDLEKSVATLIERLANVRAEQARLEAVLQRTVDNAGRLETRLALLEEKVSDLRKWREERDRKNWLLIVALVGSILTF
ncbi:MAG TPA: hypothetical protein VIL46_08010, partial [Gemmataceae bacterium]